MRWDGCARVIVEADAGVPLTLNDVLLMGAGYHRSSRVQLRVMNQPAGHTVMSITLIFLLASSLQWLKAVLFERAWPTYVPYLAREMSAMP